MSDVTYEVMDVARKTRKVVYFDRLMKASVKTKEHILSESDTKESFSNSISSDLDVVDVPLIQPMFASSLPKLVIVERLRRVELSLEAW